MIQYYIRKIIDILTYALKPKYNIVPEPPMETTTNYSYGSHPQQILDFYKGDGTTNKLFIFLHGGSWYATHRQKDHYYTAFIQYFVQNNPDISVVNMDYRLLLEENDGSINVFPDQIDDVQTVMQIFHDAGYEITLGGNSAGGHLAMWYYWQEILPKPSNVVSIVAPYYGNAPYGSGIYFDVEKTWVRNQMVSQQIRTDLGLDTFAKVSEYASPRTWIKPELDDLLVIYGTQDTTMIPSQITTYMMADYPHIRYVAFNGNHQGWHSSTMKPITSTEIRNFMLKERTFQSQHGPGRYLVEQIPEESTNNRYGHINSPFELNAIGSIDGNTFQSFKGEIIQGIISDYSLKKISYDFSGFNRAFNIITPETENGYTFMIIKNNSQRYLLTHKGFSSSKYTIRKGDTNQDVEFLTLRISNNEVLFFANTPEDWKYKIYYNLAGNGGLNSSSRMFTNIPSLYIFSSAAAANDYHFRIQGEDGNGNFTEWSTNHTDGTDAFYVPRYGQESNQYMPELEKIDLTSNLFSVVFYPTFNHDLGMIGVEYNNGQEILRSTDFDRIYANTSDAVKPNVDAVLEMHRFNPQSEQYQNLLGQLETQDLSVRAQLEWDAINGVEIPEIEIANITSIERQSETEYVIKGSRSGTLYFRKWGDEENVITDYHDFENGDYILSSGADEYWQVSNNNLIWIKTVIAFSANGRNGDYSFTKTADSPDIDFDEGFDWQIISGSIQGITGNSFNLRIPHSDGTMRLMGTDVNGSSVKKNFTPEWTPVERPVRYYTDGIRLRANMNGVDYQGQTIPEMPTGTTCRLGYRDSPIYAKLAFSTNCEIIINPLNTTQLLCTNGAVFQPTSTSGEFSWVEYPSNYLPF